MSIRNELRSLVLKRTVKQAKENQGKAALGDRWWKGRGKAKAARDVMTVIVESFLRVLS